MLYKHGRAVQQFAHVMDFGASVTPEGVRFRVWAPGCTSMGLAVDGVHDVLSMNPLADGWHEIVTSEARAQSRYRFVMPDGTLVPDPASRFQPDDVHGPSEVIDPLSYTWRHPGWCGRPWSEAIVYELHVGAFTPDGTFSAAIEKLDHLASLGVTAVEIMPVGDFAGTRNWGYDGVLLYAPDSSYGRPEDFKAFIDAAHGRGLMVLLDVIYNHFGPEGNYLPLLAPHFLTQRHQTPWGAAVNYDGPECAPVRQFVIQNALYWLEEYRLDGLRLDAVHAIMDDSERHVLLELRETVRARIGERHVHLVLENEHNAASLLARTSDGAAAHYTAQWNDDAHHVLHTAATNERNGYYEEYAGDTIKLGRALAEGFAFQGENMHFSGKPRGERSAHLTPQAFVAFIQNHDQVGNRAFGERIGMIATPEVVRAVAAVYLLLPQVPLLFMGEEWGASQPFPFFSDLSGDLARAVSEGRRKEFAAFPEFQDPIKREEIPDPQAPSTFASAKLNWNECQQERNADQLKWYQALLRTRQEQLWPRLAGITRGGEYTVLAPGAVRVRWSGKSEDLVLEANLSPQSVDGPLLDPTLEIWREGRLLDDGLGPWSVRWSLTSKSSVER
ncbi:MAG: malto-oligosyltrehalose trehalohydrolase [Burkholderiales bacterium]